jgi:hypothetical protein
LFGSEGLIVEGSPVDTICSLSDRHKMPNSPWDQAEHFLTWYESARALFDDRVTKYPLLYEQPYDAFCRTVLMGELFTVNKPSGVTSITDPITSHRAAIHNFRTNGRVPGIPAVSEVGTYMTQMVSACGARRFAVTEKGYIALVPGCAIEGDQVCVFLGSGVPYILRPASEGRFLLVGDAYIHGIMDGEALEFDDFIPHEIILC